MVIAAPTRTDAEVNDSRFARPSTATFVGDHGHAPIGESPHRNPVRSKPDHSKPVQGDNLPGEIPCRPQRDDDASVSDGCPRMDEELTSPEELATPFTPDAAEGDLPPIDLTWQTSHSVVNELDGGFDDSFDDFEEDDFDDDFDDDFEEEVEGEYELQDDEYGNEFGEFGEGPIADFEDDEDESSPEEPVDEDSD